MPCGNREKKHQPGTSRTRGDHVPRVEACGRTWLLVPLFGMLCERESKRLKEMRRPRAKWLWRRGDQLRKFTAELDLFCFLGRFSLLGTIFKSLGVSRPSGPRVPTRSAIGTCAVVPHSRRSRGRAYRNGRCREGAFRRRDDIGETSDVSSSRASHPKHALFHLAPSADPILRSPLTTVTARALSHRDARRR